jgi:hypothetical protein
MSGLLTIVTAAIAVENPLAAVQMGSDLRQS